MRPLELGIWTPALWRGPPSWGYGLLRFGVAPRVGDTDSCALAAPLELGIRTPVLLQARTVDRKDNRQSSFVLHFCLLFFSQLLRGAVPLAKFFLARIVPTKPKLVCAQT